ncbi:hypothetical protein EG346_19690 [Chryseobacterium carnipullorum]|uniref:Uncharacterized protein n=1 Tax=Chryseobacterium carnipullorum TaxID=1124835 RepID=A0A1M7D4Z3_CHRCU|nr:hypothetical protein [Chryseobacterium carnipullorum]AZA50258.1 hypothetical protein EG346_19690 [Chryseobacterium carnipullorum]AZA65130.1 hypothetical protein EG345_10730 [Chryseobacterium carnipullorum]SHL74556.1 hypothetical protein SAMN05444360_10445 [Chryseobacterium carnipullorum]STC98123.1 Uncharacterised protein [Chryseobacterium carnipullorum]HBV14409.1 hypothetical protein [Chryseobacterium carnipullorum]
MATYESLIKINGSVGDLVFYSLNGKNVVRKKSGFNKTAFKKSPSYEKVRQNSSEFGHCSKSGKTIRSCIENYSKESGDPLLYQKFAKLMTVIKDLDVVSARGKRTVQNGLISPEGLKLLRAFRFGKKENISPDIFVSEDKENRILNLGHPIPADNMAIITIQPDLEVYSGEYFEERLSAEKETLIPFKKHFSDDRLLLYFLVIKYKEEITHMGFI